MANCFMTLIVTNSITSSTEFKVGDKVYIDPGYLYDKHPKDIVSGIIIDIAFNHIEIEIQYSDESEDTFTIDSSWVWSKEEYLIRRLTDDYETTLRR